ncbi:MAG: GIY-YIG nuclease family protein [Desulfobacterales bacterium]|nr:MAG: GIY-YIG nuclease family protein [Desulfobacterales bacterium]
MTNLADLKILALDCQATGANPAKGHLLEIGWIPACASALKKPLHSIPQSYLIRLPDDAAIPRAVQRITGISEENLPAAVPSDIVWHHLLAAAGQITAVNPSATCPLVIHFARFEEPFLKDLHRRHRPARPFPFRIFCTHEIAIRLLPDLPRRGIKAIAGYYGHRLSEFKRSADHAVATAFIWQKMVELLNTACGIFKLEQLSDWLVSTRPAGRSTRTFPMNPRLRRHLPDKPGIYRMLRSNGDLLYIGKAKSLKQRVNSYFHQKAAHAEHTLEMLTQARGLDVTRTGSALEAAILESDEIKRYSPPYNIALRRHQRRLAYCTEDFSRQSPVAEKDCSVGPLPAGKSCEALAAFGVWFKNGMQSAGDNFAGMGYAVLGLPPGYAPEFDCLRQGFDVFRRQHRGHPANLSPLRFLTALGAKLWQEKLAAAALAETVDEASAAADHGDIQQNESASEFVWTPEAVAGAIERMVRHSAHLIRRARWYCLLSESTLAWTAAGQPEKYRIMIVFENGRVIQRNDFKTDGQLMTPPGFARSFRDRQKNIDLKTYDRLRVVTTELRRIISEGRDIELRLRPQVTLRRQQLIKVLQWV